MLMVQPTLSIATKTTKESLLLPIHNIAIRGAAPTRNAIVGSEKNRVMDKAER
jgi:hypothetical protein